MARAKAQAEVGVFTTATAIKKEMAKKLADPIAELKKLRTKFAYDVDHTEGNWPGERDVAIAIGRMDAAIEALSGLPVKA